MNNTCLYGGCRVRKPADCCPTASGDLGGESLSLLTAWQPADVHSSHVLASTAITFDGSAASTSVTSHHARFPPPSRSNIPAPAPIEVRWTAGSSSPLSPAVGPPDSVHCWVGVIMYLPADDQQQRDKVTQA